MIRWRWIVYHPIICFQWSLIFPSNIQINMSYSHMQIIETIDESLVCFFLYAKGTHQLDRLLVFPSSHSVYSTSMFLDEFITNVLWEIWYIIHIQYVHFTHILSSSNITAQPPGTNTPTTALTGAAGLETSVLFSVGSWSRYQLPTTCGPKTYWCVT